MDLNALLDRLKCRNFETSDDSAWILASASQFGSYGTIFDKHLPMLSPRLRFLIHSQLLLVL